MNGLLKDGWSFVYSAYGVSALLLGYYAVRTFVVFRTLRRVSGITRPS